MPSSVSNWCSKQKYATQKKYTGLHKPVLETMIWLYVYLTELHNFFFKNKEREQSFGTPRLLELIGFIFGLIHDEIMCIAVLL
jgi:hypothetical protein